MFESRLPDWRARLARFLDDRRGQGFVWGERDCALTVADAVIAMTGRDLAASLRGYRSRAGARLALRARGFDSLLGYLDAVAPRAPRGRCGDMGLIAGGRLGPLVLLDGRGGAWGQDVAGIVRAPFLGALVWEV